MITESKAGKAAYHERWFRYFLPYALVCLEKRVWLPVNRNYKPLGHMNREHVEYADYRAQAMVFRKDPATFEGIFTAAREGILYLYDDGPESRVDYFERPGRLVVLQGAEIATKPHNAVIPDHPLRKGSARV